MPQRVIFFPGRDAAKRQATTKTRRGSATNAGVTRQEGQRMVAKKKAKELQNDIMDSAHKVWLAGLGAVAMAEDEGAKFFSDLVDKGKNIEKRSKKQTKERVEQARGTVAGMKTVAESYWETFGRTIDDKVTTVIHRIGVPTKDEIETLTKKVEDLTASIDKLRTKEAATARARATTAKKATAAKRATTTKKAATAKKATPTKK